MEATTPTTMSANGNLEPLLSIEKAGDLIGISPWTVRHHLRTGKIGSVRIGRRILIEPAEIRRIVKEGRRDSMREVAVAV
jgi:excisionase family DNA binding protein